MSTNRFRVFTPRSLSVVFKERSIFPKSAPPLRRFPTVKVRLMSKFTKMNKYILKKEYPD